MPRTTILSHRLGAAFVAFATLTALFSFSPISPISAPPAGAAPPWDQLGTDLDGSQASDELGYAVALSSDGSRIAVAAKRGGVSGGNTGYVRVFEWSGTTWTQMGPDIEGQGNKTLFSVALSADGTRVAFGEPFVNSNGSAAGQVQVYDWTGATWSKVGSSIEGQAVAEQLGYSIALSDDGSDIAVGGPGSSSLSGVVRVYNWSGSAWTQTGSDITGEAFYDTAGWAVDVSANGNRVAVGAPGNDGTDPSAGHVRVYDLSGSTWTQVGVDIDGEAEDDRSGTAVALSSDGGRLAIGAAKNDGVDVEAGHVRVYQWSGSAWVQLGNDLDGTAGDTQAGSSVALSEDGSRVAYGSSGDGAGSVKVLQWSGSAWVQVGGDVAGETLDDQFGFSIDLSAEGTAFAAGAISNQGDEIGASAGHVRVHGSVSNTPVPDAPTNVIATAGNGQVDLSWNAPANPGGSAIIGYTATATPGGATCTTTGALTCTVSSLTNGTPYSFTVVATNSDGSSAPSEGSAWVTPAAAPSAPTGVFGVPNDSAASIGWSEPADDGGSPVISYVVTASPGGSTCSTDGTLTCIVPNLTNGTQYTFTVTATNAVGTSGASDPSDPVTPAPVPGQPLSVSAVPGSGLANVSWSAPATAGTDNIIAYTATASPGGARCATTGALTCTVAGLTNGTEYTFTVTATNAIGTGDPSDPSDAVMPVGAPLAPRSVAATAQPASAVVAWAAPLSDGGSTITGYTATSSPGSSTCSTTGTLSCTVTGLSNGTAYTFTITATNALGTSPSSIPSDPVTPTDVPVAPTAVAATAGNAQAAVSWAGSVDNGGSPISAYTVTSSPAGGACATAGDLTCTVTGLTNGTTYTFTVTATNDNGLSPASDPSNAVTPSENPNTPQNVTVTPDGDGNADVSWDPPPNPDGDIDGYVVTVSPDGEGCTTDGETTCTVTGLINGQTYTFTVVVVIDGEEGVGSAVTVPGTGIDGGTVTGLPGSGGSTQGDAESEPGTCPAPLLPFDDANTVISVSDVACIYGLGITGGTTPTTYSPNQAVDRNQMASFIARLWRAAGLECPAATASFVDLSFAISAADVSCIWAIGITGGTTPTTYSPGEAVDRNQMASFLARLWRETGRSCPSPELPFTDVDTVISVSDVACIYGLGITGGTTPTTYSPNQTVDRNQMASFLARLWRALGDD